MEATDPKLEGKELPDITDFTAAQLQEFSVTPKRAKEHGLNVAYDPPLDKVDPNKLLASITLDADKVYSDHVPTSRVVEGTKIVTFNASFVLLTMQGNATSTLHPNDKPKVGGDTHGSEGLMARVVESWWKRKFELPFTRFVRDVVRDDTPVVLLQEWVSAPKDGRNGTHEAANRFAKTQLAGYRFFETHSGFEGSCIAYLPGSAQPLYTADQANALEGADFWAWCGVSGRTWSAVRVTPANKRDFLCINLHGPNMGPDGSAVDKKGKVKATSGPFAQTMRPFFSEVFRENADWKNQFFYEPKDAHLAFVTALLSGEQSGDEMIRAALQTLRRCYYDCNQRLVIGGDWNDMYVSLRPAPVKATTQRL